LGERMLHLIQDLLDNPDSYTSRENLKDPGEMPRAGIIR